MKKEWEWTFKINTLRSKVLLSLIMMLIAVFMIWFVRVPIPLSNITINDVQVTGGVLTLDGTYNDKFARYKSYSIRTTYSFGSSSSDMIIKLYGGYVFGSRDIYIETKVRKNIRAIYLYTPGNERAKKLWSIE